jgi:hypothetical protein
MTIRLVARVYDAEWSDAWPFGSPLATRLSRLLAEAGYNVTAIDAVKVNTADNLFSFVDLVTVTIVMQPTTGATDTRTVTQTLRTIIVSATGYPPASIAVVSAGQGAPAPITSVFDRVFGNIGATLEAITAGTSILTWAIVIGAVVVVYSAASSPGAVKKWIG